VSLSRPRRVLSARGTDFGIPRSFAVLLFRIVSGLLRDAKLTDLDGPEVCRRIRQHGSKIRVLILSSYVHAALIGRSISTGADGIALKELPLEDVKKNVFEDLPALQAILDVKIHDFLSPIDRAIVGHVANGLTDKEIGRALGLSHNTVKDRLEKIYRLLRVRGRSKLVAEAIRASSKRDAASEIGGVGPSRRQALSPRVSPPRRA
jgi:two-component system nitrate/nitrite response regulator NarL